VRPSLDPRQLRYFVAVVDEGQITRAARKLHIAQPALSQVITRLEASVGVPLLERSARGVSPTPAGRALYEKAHAVLLSLEEAEAAVAPWQRGNETLRLGFLQSLHLVARSILRQFLAIYPDVDVRVHHLGVSERLVALKRGQIDVELIVPATPDPELHVEIVAYSPRFVLLHEKHALAAEQSLVFDQIADETFPGRHPSIPEKWAEETWLIHYRGHAPRVTQETPLTLDETWALIYAGKAVAVLPEFMVPPASGDGVRALPLTDVDPMPIGLARRRDDARLAITALFDLVRDYAAARPAFDDR
jgi:DNA-binding transcriptional LysR family regulator